MQLPTQAPALSKWSLWDYGLKIWTSQPATAAGVALIELDQVPDNELWLVDRIMISCTSAVDSAFALYRDQVALGNRVDWTDLGNDNVADEAASPVLPPATSLLAQWTGADPASVGTITLQWTILRPTPLPDAAAAVGGKPWAWGGR